MLQTVHGSAVYYADGDQPGASARPAASGTPTVVFIHGALNDHHVWAAQAGAFAARGWRVLPIDLPGHGCSQGRALTSVAALARWLLALLDVAGVGHAMLAGHSMGALIALEAAALAPGRVSRLALLGVTVPMPVSGRLLATARDDQPAAIELVTGWSHRRDGADATLVDATRQLQHRVAGAYQGPLLYLDLNACNDYGDGIAAARAVRCPALLLLGRHDLMTPAKSAAPLAAALAQCTIVDIDSGHAMMAEQPDAVSAALLAFADSPQSV